MLEQTNIENLRGITNSETEDSWQISVTYPILTVIITFILLFVLAFCIGMRVDEGVWNYMGWLWAKAKIPPYIGSVESKTPGISYIFAVSNFLFGVNFWFPRLLGVLAITLNAVVIYLIGQRLRSRLCGVFSMLIFGLTMTWGLLDSQFTAQTESFMNLFTTCAFFLLIKTREAKEATHYLAGLFLSGFFIGLAIFFKQIAILSALALILFYFFYFDTQNDGMYRSRDLFIIIAGGISATFITLIPLLAYKVTLLDYWNGAWMILFYPGTSAGIFERIYVFTSIWTKSRLVLFYPLVFLFLSQKKKIRANNIPFWGLVSWMILDFIGANASGHRFGHQLKQLIPSLTATSGIGIDFFLDIAQSRKRILVIMITVSILILWMPYSLYYSYAGFHCPVTQPYYQPEKEVAEWVKEHTTPDDYVYAYCFVNALQAYMERKSPSRYFNNNFLGVPGAKEEVIRDIIVKKPKYILYDLKQEKVYECQAMPVEIINIMKQSYRYVLTKNGYRIYEINNPSLIKK